MYESNSFDSYYTFRHIIANAGDKKAGSIVFEAYEYLNNQYNTNYIFSPFGLFLERNGYQSDKTFDQLLDKEIATKKEVKDL